MRKLLTFLCAIFIAPSLAIAESEAAKPIFPGFAQGYWKLEGRGSTSYTIEAELTENRHVYKTEVKGQPACIFDISQGDKDGEYRYTTDSGGNCNNGTFTLSQSYNGDLVIRWRRPGRSGKHVLSPDIEKMRSYRQQAGLSKPVTDTADIEGEWTGSMAIGGMIGSLDVTMAATAEGAELELDRLTVHCKAILPPKSDSGAFDAFLVQSRGCKDGRISLTLVNGDLEVVLQSTGATALLRRLSGPRDPGANPVYPDISFRKIGLGGSLSEIEAVVEEGGRLTSAQPLKSALNAGSFMGVGNIPYLNATFRSLHYPLSHRRYPEDMDEDNIAAYALDGRIAAIYRVYTPVPDNAPTLETFHNALVQAYGEPSIQSKQGRRTELEWHYASDGTLLSDQVARSQCVAKGSVAHSNARQIGMRYRWFEQLFDLSIRKKNAVPSYMLRPVQGCGSSFVFIMSARQDGSLQQLTSVGFSHTAIASGIWESRKVRIGAGIRERLKLNAKRETLAPKL
jgi:hypothetical protein